MNLLQATLILSVTLIVVGTGLVVASAWLIVRGRVLGPDRVIPHIPSSDELDYVKENPLSKILSVAAIVSKALAAAVAAGAAAYSAAEVAGAVGAGEWVTVVVAAVGAFVIAYAAPKNTESI